MRGARSTLRRILRRAFGLDHLPDGQDAVISNTVIAPQQELLPTSLEQRVADYWTRHNVTLHRVFS